MSLPNSDFAGLPEGTNFGPDDWFAFQEKDTLITKKIKASLLNSPTSADIEWDPGTSYNIDEIVTYGGNIWQSLENANDGNIPTESTHWTLLTRGSSGLNDWAAGVYLEDFVTKYYSIAGKRELFLLVSGTRPYNSVDFDVELAAGDWLQITDNRPWETVDTTGATIVIDFFNLYSKKVNGSDVIDGNRTIQFDQDDFADEIKAVLSLDDLHDLVFPNTVKMSDARWDNSTFTWTADSPGEYFIRGWRNGSNWYIRINEPYV